ncbi:MAG: hypothetical protein H0X73_14550, partial [Chthoniobacterales bacterium]|nr:hypothetical protein [Chthoniobacterales bacterium]
SYAARLLQRLAAEFGFEHQWAFCARYLPQTPTVGLTLTRIRELYREAHAILNVCGAQEFNEDLLTSDRLLYIESDPGVAQIRVDQGDCRTVDILRRHRALFSFGENVGTSAFPVPTHGLTWWPTRQPVVIDFWKTNRAPKAGALLTTVANLNTAGKKDIEWRGEKYLWNKTAELVHFLSAPARAGEAFELATTVEEQQLAAALERNGWCLRAVEAISIDHQRYRHYIRSSKGEFTVAKDQYVRLNTGWFSDRSACYLAAGRPVITQETGFTKHYGNAGGVFAFRSLADIVEAVKMINADYAHHSRAACAIAREVFAADKVLSSLLDRAGI